MHKCYARGFSQGKLGNGLSVDKSGKLRIPLGDYPQLQQLERVGPSAIACFVADFYAGRYGL